MYLSRTKKYKGILREQEKAMVDKIYHMAYSLLGKEHDAWDLTQEVFLELEKGRQKWENAESKIAWAIGVFRRQRKRFLRMKKKMKGDILSGDYLSHEANVADQAMMQEELQKTFQAIQTLNKDMAESLLLFSVEQIPVKEIAEKQKVSIGTVKWRIFEARRRLLHQVGSKI